MNATITKINRDTGRIDVTVLGREYGLDTRNHPELDPDILFLFNDPIRVGDIIQVKREANNPFLIPVEN